MMESNLFLMIGLRFSFLLGYAVAFIVSLWISFPRNALGENAIMEAVKNRTEKSQVTEQEANIVIKEGEEGLSPVAPQALDGVGGDIQEVFVPDSREKKIMERAEEKQRMRYQLAIEKRRQNKLGSGLAQERGKKALRGPSAASGKSPVKSLSKGNGKIGKGQGNVRSKKATKKAKGKVPIPGEARAQKKTLGKAGHISRKGSSLNKSSSGRKPASMPSKKATPKSSKKNK